MENTKITAEERSHPLLLEFEHKIACMGGFLTESIIVEFVMRNIRKQ